MFEMRGKYTSAKVMLDVIEPEASRQIQVMVNHPAATENVAIMPDTHAGKGCVIGFTMKMGEKVVPNWIGVDIGCGMLSVDLGKVVLSDKELAFIDRRIREEVPMGMNVHCSVKKSIHEGFICNLRNRASHANHPAAKRYSQATEKDILDILKRIGMNEGRFWASIGTLGGGNHFIEIGKDESDHLWLTIHTGSRNFGKTVCEHFDDKAVSLLKKVDVSGYAAELKEKVARGELDASKIGGLLAQKKADSKLDFDVKSSAYIVGEMLDDYLSLMFVAQTYAEMSRKLMADRIVAIISTVLCGTAAYKSPIIVGDYIETVHNFISFEDHIIRKGAVQSYGGKRMVIPFNMRDGLLICDGKSNPEWNFSAPHGAGRLMSRRQAKEKVLLEDYQNSMDGIFTTSVCQGTLDESPMAYKDAAMIEAAIEPTARIIHRVKPIYNVKAGEE